MAPYEPSMKLDRDAGRAMELERFTRGPGGHRQGGGRAPLIEALYLQLREAEKSRGR